MTNTRTWLFTLALGQTLLNSCGVMTQGSNLEVVKPDGSIQTINMAPRHYRVKDHCKEVLLNATPNLLSSTAPLTTEQKAKMIWPARISSYKPGDCEYFHRRGRIMKDYEQVFSSREDKIGVILPPSASNEAALQLILDEFKAALKRNGVHDEAALIIRRVEKSDEAAFKAAAELVHLNRVSMLVGVNSIHTQAMTRLADFAQVPLFMVNPSSRPSSSRQSMRIYPPVERLAAKLLDQYRQREVTHTTVLYAKGSDLDLLDALKKLSGHSIYFMESSYDPSSPADVLATVKGAASRMSVVRTKSQGLLVLDNFKMVRHIVNIVRHSIGDIGFVMTGNQQWRSPALVVPREEALEGAMFVDFIGSYADLPQGLQVPIPESPFFTTAQAASRIDYQIIGHRLGTLSAQVLRKNWGRQRIAAELQSLTNSWDNYFPVGAPAFDKNRDSSWPAFLFKVQGETIVVENGSSVIK